MRKGVTPTDLEKIAIIAGERNITFAQALQYIDMFAERIPSSGNNRIIVFSAVASSRFLASNRDLGVCRAFRTFSRR